MAFEKAKKIELVKEYQLHDKDTASSQVQVAILTERLNYLNEHFKTNPKDHHSRQGLLKLVGQRKKLLAYLNKKDHESYKTVISKLGIRK